MGRKPEIDSRKTKLVTIRWRHSLLVYSVDYVVLNLCQSYIGSRLHSICLALRYSFLDSFNKSSICHLPGPILYACYCVCAGTSCTQTSPVSIRSMNIIHEIIIVF